MKTFRKPLAILLVVMLAFSMFSIGVTASAAEDTNAAQTHEGTITVASNVASTATVDYQSYNDSVIVTYYTHLFIF